MGYMNNNTDVQLHVSAYILTATKRPVCHKPGKDGMTPGTLRVTAKMPLFGAEVMIPGGRGGRQIGIFDNDKLPPGFFSTSSFCRPNVEELL